MTIRQTALNMLAHREHSKYELQQKLLRKNFSLDDVEQLIERLSAQQLINEDRFIENYIYSRQKKGYGPLRIQHELREKGIAHDVINEYLQAHDIDWISLAQQVRCKRFKNKMPSDNYERAKQMRFLSYRGFNQEQIQSVFREIDY